MDSYEMIRSTLATNIKRERKIRGLSQERLALNADVNRTFVSQIERKIGNPSLHTLCRIADHLNIPCHELLIQQQ
ncbi:MAG: helix-turn-helix transcriptional regulator [Gammaproteobacteria bacterium]|nr:helix-turn-helix transcriptional regulator [Gammaproteobacteria bacterium]